MYQILPLKSLPGSPKFHNDQDLCCHYVLADDLGPAIVTVLVKAPTAARQGTLLFTSCLAFVERTLLMMTVYPVSQALVGLTL